MAESFYFLPRSKLRDRSAANQCAVPGTQPYGPVCDRVAVCVFRQSGFSSARRRSWPDEHLFCVRDARNDVSVRLRLLGIRTCTAHPRPSDLCRFFVRNGARLRFADQASWPDADSGGSLCTVDLEIIGAGMVSLGNLRRRGGGGAGVGTRVHRTAELFDFGQVWLLLGTNLYDAG